MDVIETVIAKIVKWTLYIMLGGFLIGMAWGVISRAGGPLNFFSYFGKFSIGFGDEII